LSQIIRKQLGKFLQIGESQVAGVAVPYSDWIISTEDPDAIGDVIIPGGIEIDHWVKQKCPWLLCHDEKCLIGNAIDPASSDFKPEYHVDGDRVYARCFHDLGTEEGRKAWYWVNSKSVNGASVGVRPIQVRQANSAERRLGIKRIVERCSLFEVTIVPTPCNPNTQLIQSVFPDASTSKGIEGMIYKSLNSLEKTMADKPADDLNTKPDATPVETESENEPPTKGYAKAFLESMANHLSAADQEIGRTESETGKPILEKCMKDMCKACKDMHEGISGIHSDLEMPADLKSLCEKYKSEEKADDNDPEPEPEPEPTEEEKSIQEALKSMGVGSISEALNVLSAMSARHEQEIEGIHKSLTVRKK
jgi:hypothetical protein